MGDIVRCTECSMNWVSPDNDTDEIYPALDAKMAWELFNDSNFIGGQFDGAPWDSLSDENKEGWHEFIKSVGLMIVK